MNDVPLLGGAETVFITSVNAEKVDTGTQFSNTALSFHVPLINECVKRSD